MLLRSASAAWMNLKSSNSSSSSSSSSASDQVSNSRGGIFRMLLRSASEAWMNLQWTHQQNAPSETIGLVHSLSLLGQPLD
jgi:acyl-CoA-binding protein